MQTYNNAIPGLVQTRVAAGKHIVVVDMYAAFTANTNYKTALMNDDLHPNDAGYMVMAQTWYAAIGSYLPGNCRSLGLIADHRRAQDLQRQVVPEQRDRVAAEVREVGPLAPASELGSVTAPTLVKVVVSSMRRIGP